MEIPAKYVVIQLFAVGAVILVLLVGSSLRSSSYDRKMTELQDQLALRDKTAEVQQGVYKKLALQVDDVKSLLDARDEQVSALRQELKKRHEELVTVTSAVVTWKHAYEASVMGEQTQAPPDVPGGKTRTRVDFRQDFGHIGVSGYTLTDPPSAHLKVEQLRPLRLTLALSQAPDGHWSTYVTSSESDVGVDVGLSGVSPRAFERRWYERLGVNLSVGGGATAAGLAGLGGAGLLYDFGRFELGPTLWTTVSLRVDRFYGASIIWRPFKRSR